MLLWEKYRAPIPRIWLYLVLHDLGGEKVFVDFVGDTIDIFDPITGEAPPIRLFVTAMGAPNYTYAEACPSESLPDWIGVHIDPFTFLGGVSTPVRASRRNARQQGIARNVVLGSRVADRQLAAAAPAADRAASRASPCLGAP